MEFSRKGQLYKRSTLERDNLKKANYKDGHLYKGTILGRDNSSRGQFYRGLNIERYNSIKR